MCRIVAFCRVHDRVPLASPAALPAAGWVWNLFRWTWAVAQGCSQFPLGEGDKFYSNRLVSGDSVDQGLHFKVYHNTLCTKSQLCIRHVSMLSFSPFCKQMKSLTSAVLPPPPCSPRCRSSSVHRARPTATTFAWLTRSQTGSRDPILVKWILPLSRRLKAAGAERSPLLKACVLTDFRLRFECGAREPRGHAK